MTRQEFAVLIKSVNEIYPQTITDSNSELWYRLVADVGYTVAAQRLADYMRKEHFPPKPADLIPKKTKFNNFPERNYDMLKLERALLGIDTYNGIEEIKEGIDVRTQ